MQYNQGNLPDSLYKQIYQQKMVLVNYSLFLTYRFIMQVYIDMHKTQFSIPLPLLILIKVSCDLISDIIIP